MESRRLKYCTIFWFFYISISATTLFFQSEGRKYAEKLTTQHQKIARSSIGVEKENHLNIGQPLEFTLLSSPFSLPPFDSLSPQDSPPCCADTPFSPSPSVAKPEPPPPTNTYSPFSPGPTTAPYGPNPPKPSPSSPAYLPPVLYPPPPPPPPPPAPPSGSGGPPPPEHKRSQFAVWCVAKPTVPDSVMQEAMDYACGSGADCKSIQPNGPCYQPNTLLAHASYAFNSYFQNRKLAGGSCDFGGTAMLVTDDPSFDECLFIHK